MNAFTLGYTLRKQGEESSKSKDLPGAPPMPKGIVPKPKPIKSLTSPTKALATSSSLDPVPQTELAVPGMKKLSGKSNFRAGMEGALEGARGGTSIATNTLTLGLSDWLNLTNSKQYQGKDYDASRGLATVSSLLLPGLGIAKGLKGLHAGAKGAKGLSSAAKARAAAAGGGSALKSYGKELAKSPAWQTGTGKAVRQVGELASWTVAPSAVRMNAQLAKLIGKAPGIRNLAAKSPEWARKGVNFLAGTNKTRMSRGFGVADRISTTALPVATYEMSKNVGDIVYDAEGKPRWYGWHDTETGEPIVREENPYFGAIKAKILNARKRKYVEQKKQELQQLQSGR